MASLSRKVNMNFMSCIRFNALFLLGLFLECLSRNNHFGESLVSHHGLSDSKEAVELDEISLSLVWKSKKIAEKSS